MKTKHSCLKGCIFVITIIYTRLFHMYGHHFISRHTKKICADIRCYIVVHCDVPKVSIYPASHNGYIKLGLQCDAR